MLAFDGAGLSAKLSDDFSCFAADFYVINTAAPGAVNLASGGNEHGISFAGCQKTNATALGHNPLIVAVTSMGKGGVSEGEDQPAVANSMAIELVGRDGHGDRGKPRGNLCHHKAQSMAGGII